MIRGKGSVKEGKVGRKDGQMLPGEDEPLHALVTANTMENVKKAVEQVRGCPRGAQGGGPGGAAPPSHTPCAPPLQIRNILKQGIETPEDQNDLRKMQLRELARLNGTLREDDNRSEGSHLPDSFQNNPPKPLNNPSPVLSPAS